ncbi:MAG: Verru Chthon cassette protein [Verrucomicrobiaceae bacterium]|nr:Verru Chthon cassette protein [Verrucomicrobiaceae bacterium]
MSQLLSLPNPPKKRRGFAIVSVLALTILATVIVMAMLSLATVSVKTEDSALEMARARWTGNTAVSIALGQLIGATKEQFADGTPKPWTSQPGAIRVHAMDGTLEKLHKLYSASVMETNSLADVAKDVPDDWQQRPDDFVDLNAPRTTTNGGLHFPVVDPRAKTIDPLTSVEGFDYTATSGAVGPDAGANQQRLPMPVRWIYQRRDGSLATLDDEHKLSPANNNPNNPIVARFAYWVDDESCKVNINTAAEGAFWDVPRADTVQERALAANQPTRREYHREPGHPAGVCLSSVLMPGRRLYPQNFMPAETTSPGSMVPMSLNDARDLWRLGRLAVAELGSKTSWAGTARPDWQQLWNTMPQALVRQGPYANVNELLFDSAKPENFPTLWENNQTGKRTVHSFFRNHPEAIARLPMTEFFLTAQSSAPETTLYGTPRIAMWPVDARTLTSINGIPTSDPVKRDTAYEHKLALGCMLKGKPYFVQRQEPGDGAKDLEGNAGGANKVLLDYLKRLTGSPVPGFSRADLGYGTFADKYGDDREAILLQMLDYIRATNFADGQVVEDTQFSVLCPANKSKGFGQIAPLQQRVTGAKAATSDHPQGQGRVMTVSEVALMIVCRAQSQFDEDGKVKVLGDPSSEEVRTELEKHPGLRELEVGILVEGFLPGQSWTDYRPYINVALVGGPPDTFPAPPREGPVPNLPLMKINGKPLTLLEKHSSMESDEQPPTKWQGSGGNTGVRGLAKGLIQFEPILVEASPDNNDTKLKFEGGSSSESGDQFKLAIYDSPGSTSVSDLLHVIPLVFPDIGMDTTAGATIPLPSFAEGMPASLKSRMADACENTDAHLFSHQHDVVQSLTPIHGDYRLTAAQRWLQSRQGNTLIPIFSPHPLWGKEQFAHNLRDETIASATETQGYISTLAYTPVTRPDMPSSLVKTAPLVTLWNSGSWMQYTADSESSKSALSQALVALRRDQGIRGDAVPEATGDFDNGIADAPDGSYVNRADDGHWAAAVDETRLPYFDNVSQVGNTVPPVTLAGFSAQRLLPSPVMFGSLPTGTRAQVPWQTLLFRPQPGHFGAKSPPDYLLLDMFWSPVIEPEPSKEAFETAGKINLNHELLPFRNITRATALHAAFKAETMMAIPDSAASTYKTNQASNDAFRTYIDTASTLKLWKDAVFSQDKVFLTAGQLCEQPLVPVDLFPPGEAPSIAATETFWSTHRLTGDNTKERPYADLYSRLTTRSNTFRVHFIAQAIKQARSTPNGRFGDPDMITASTQGTCLLQRHLDTLAPDLPNYQAPTSTGLPAKPLDAFYRWHREAVQTIW